MIEVSLINAYTGSRYFEYIQQELSFDNIPDIEVFISTECITRYDMNSMIRLLLYSEAQDSISQLLSYFKSNDQRYNISEIEFILIECTLDMCPIIQTVMYCGNKYVHDFHEDIFKLVTGDVVFNYRDGKFYYIKNDPSVYSLKDIMWNDDNPSCEISKYDIHKVSECEFRYFHLDKLVSLISASSEIERANILKNITNDHPRLVS